MADLRVPLADEVGGEEGVENALPPVLPLGKIEDEIEGQPLGVGVALKEIVGTRENTEERVPEEVKD